MNDLKEVMAIANAFAKANLPECAAELIEWSDTALLRNGKVRELARILEAVDSAHALTLAENAVKRAALAHCARTPPTESTGSTGSTGEPTL